VNVQYIDLINSISLEQSIGNHVFNNYQLQLCLKSHNYALLIAVRNLAPNYHCMWSLTNILMF